MIDREEDARNSVSDFRKAVYEFALSQDPEDFQRMMQEQVKLVTLAASAAAPQVVADERKPFAFVIVDKDRNPEFVTPDWDSAQEHINDACEMSIENAGKWKAIPAFEMRPTDDKLWDETMKDRDQYQEWADKLAEAIALYFGADIGEHSNMNCPWAEALEIIEQAAPVQAQEPEHVPVRPGHFPQRDPSKPAEQQGVFKKFDVWRTDGSSAPGGKHRECRYFVLDVDHDALAKPALQAYAAACATTHPDLSEDMVKRFDLTPVQPVAVPDGWRDKLVGLTVSMDVSTGDDDAFHRVFGKVESIMPQGDSHVILAVESSRNFAAPAAQGEAKELTVEDLYQMYRDSYGKLNYEVDPFDTLDEMEQKAWRNLAAAIAAKAAS